MKKFITFAVLTLSTVNFVFSQETDSSTQPLKPESGKEFELIKPVSQGEERRLERQKHFLVRQSQDRANFSPVLLRELEDLYQIANIQSKTPEAKAGLEKLIKDSRFEKTNRFGCALIYLATISGTMNVEELLKKAVEEYSDCWYGDGVNVGAYATYLLGGYYHGLANKEAAKQCFSQLKTKYPDAIGHAGQILVDKIPSEYTEK